MRCLTAGPGSGLARPQGCSGDLVSPLTYPHVAPRPSAVSPHDSLFGLRCKSPEHASTRIYLGLVLIVSVGVFALAMFKVRPKAAETERTEHHRASETYPDIPSPKLTRKPIEGPI